MSCLYFFLSLFYTLLLFLPLFALADYLGAWSGSEKFITEQSFELWSTDIFFTLCLFLGWGFFGREESALLLLFLFLYKMDGKSANFSLCYSFPILELHGYSLGVAGMLFASGKRKETVTMTRPRSRRLSQPVLKKTELLGLSNRLL